MVINKGVRLVSGRTQVRLPASGQLSPHDIVICGLNHSCGGSVAVRYKLSPATVGTTSVFGPEIINRYGLLDLKQSINQSTTSVNPTLN